MRVRMTTQLFGAINGVEPPAPGDEMDVPAEEAVRMINAGQAVPVGLPPVETASLAPVPDLWPGTYRLRLPDGDRGPAAGDVRTDGRALTSRSVLDREEGE